jgi:AcrR family transcriptional regulator
VPVEKWTPERRMERTRAALIASARHLFATRGFEGASLDEIAEAAGYTRGAIYKHFANKEDLLFAVSDSLNEEVLDTFAEQLEDDPGYQLDEIAEAAGYTRGAIYRHFANKEDLFFAVSDAVNTEILDTFAEELDLEESSAVDENAHYAAMWMKALAGNAELWALNVEWSLFQYRNPRVRERSAESLRENRERVAAFMEHYMSAQGFRFKLPVETVAAMLLNAADGFATMARLDPDTERLFATFLDLFLPTVIEEAPAGGEETK